MSRFYEFRKRNARSILVATITSLVCLAWWNRFIQDDAFISFRYADNLARGLGLVWNAGERVEGYTNFLWTLFMSLVLVLRGDPVFWSAAIGISAFAASLTLTHRISLHIFQSDDVSLLSVVLLGTNYTFSAYATGGLETSLQAMLSLAVVYRIVRAISLKRCKISDAIVISFLLSLCMLLRLDSGLLCFVVFVFTFFTILRKSGEAESRWGWMVALTIPFAVIIGSLFVWKISYYGDILPNTFYVKVSSVHSLSRGAAYLHRFLSSYLLYPIALLSLFSLKSFFGNVRVELLLLFLIAAAWTAYVVKVGGDFMEFRFIVPIMPMLVILFLWLVFEFCGSLIVRAGLLLLVLGGSAHHVLTFSYDPGDGIEPIRQLQSHITARDEQWGEIGKTLGKAFNEDPRVSVATTAAGAIPYYSRLTTIDMLGLNDRYIAKFGYYFGRAAGHERIATLGYLEERKVNLIVSHPYVTSIGEPMIRVPNIPGVEGNRLPESKAVEIPIDSLYKVIVLYLTPSPVVDSVIESRHWKVHQILKR